MKAPEPHIGIHKTKADFMSAEKLFTSLQSWLFDINFDVVLEDLRKNEQQHLFWNMIYYFNSYLLPYDFILPYENHKELLFEYDAHRYKKAQRKEINFYTEE
jgi:hypothetical protein